METFKYEKIRNVAILGHGGCGKTTLVEAMAYTTGITGRQGKTEDGNTISDYDKEEIKRLFSISSTVVPIIFEDTKINFIDTPGYFDFRGETEEALNACDAAVIVISAKAGIESGTKRAYEYCERFKLPRIFFVTDMDDNNASFRQVVEELDALYGKKIAPFHSPIREDGKFVGFVNVVKMAGRRFTKMSEYEECEIPDYQHDYVDNYRESLLEAVAETSEELMEKYFNGEEFTTAEMSTALRSSVTDLSIIPVLMGSGLHCQGTTMLLQAIEKYFPSPNKLVITGINQKTNSTFTADYDASKPMTAKVFKTIADPFIGRFSLIKVCSGVLKSDSVIYNCEKDTEEKLSRLYVLRGKEQIEVKELYAGDIGAIGKLSNTATYDTLSTKETPVIYDKPSICPSYEYRSFVTKNKADDDKVNAALAKIMEEDLTIHIVNDKENSQTLLYGIGKQQLELVASKLLSRYKIEIELSKPRIPYKETIKKTAKVREKYKKQSGGHGQYGDVEIEFSPLDTYEKHYEFEEKVFGGAIPKNFFPAVEKGIAEGVLKGPLAGYPVVGVKATLIDGSYHPVDSSEMAFKTASINAFKKGILEASPIILEPIVLLTITADDAYTGDILSDLNKRRGRVLGMNPLYNGKQEISAHIPLSEIYDYSTTLLAMTGGMGDYSYEFSSYEPASMDVAQKVIDESHKSM